MSWFAREWHRWSGHHEVRHALRTVSSGTLAVATMGLLLLLGSQHVALAAFMALALLGAGVVSYLRDAVRRAYLVALGVGLLGYAVLGRGFAYVGVPPVYVGEVLLLLGAVVLLRSEERRGG